MSLKFDKSIYLIKDGRVYVDVEEYAERLQIAALMLTPQAVLDPSLAGELRGMYQLAQGMQASAQMILASEVEEIFNGPTTEE